MSADSFTMEQRVFTDERTGREVRQLTDGDFECATAYMDKPVWTVDERRMVIISNRGGSWQPYRLTVDTGECVQILSTENDVWQYFVDECTSQVYVADGKRLLAADLETLEVRTAVDFGTVENANVTALPVLNIQGTLALAKDVRGMETTFYLAATDGSNDIDAFVFDDLLCFPGHEQFRPGDDMVISVNAMNPDPMPEGRIAYDWDSDDDESRTKTWRVDLLRKEFEPLIVLPKGESATHCVWNRSGTRLHFHRKTRPTWVPTALCSVDDRGGDMREHFVTSKHRLGHSCPSPNEEWIVTDSQDPDTNILMLVHLERKERHMLCWPNNSIGSDRADKRSADLPAMLPSARHTHPGFSPSGRFVHYTSDVSGRSQVYVTPVDDLLGI